MRISDRVGRAGRWLGTVRFERRQPANHRSADSTAKLTPPLGITLHLPMMGAKVECLSKSAISQVLTIFILLVGAKTNVHPM
jgi:hypothetical protein